MRSIGIAVFLSLALPVLGQRGQAPSAAFQLSFQQAYAAYRAGRFAEAASQLEGLVKQTPKSFDVQELLGLSYAAEKRSREAAEHLRVAVTLAPNTVSARNNLATALMQTGHPGEAEAEWHAALRTDPRDYQVNRNLARLYLLQGKLAEAVPLLETARTVQPTAADNAYDLARAYELMGKLADARTLAEALLEQQHPAEAHALLGSLDEREAHYVEAVREYSLAAHLDPSEENLFGWANELMTHRAYEPAIAVFGEGTRRYPASARLWVGEGMALYARGEYEASVRALLKATDLHAEDARAYLFLSKAFLSSPSQADAVIERFRRYAELRPNDARAQFDYGIALWKGKRVNTPEIDYPAVEALLRRSIALDPRDAEVHLQLGILFNDQRELDQAQKEFERAAQLDPKLADAHFRLGRAYLKAGEKEKAQAELDRFKQLQAEHQAAVDKERAEVQQFVIATQTASAGTAKTTGEGQP